MPLWAAPWSVDSLLALRRPPLNLRVAARPSGAAEAGTAATPTVAVGDFVLFDVDVSTAEPTAAAAATAVLSVRPFTCGAPVRPDLAAQCILWDGDVAFDSIATVPVRRRRLGSPRCGGGALTP